MTGPAPSPAVAALIAGLPRCGACDRPMRPVGASRHDWPGTIGRGRRGLCGGSCSLDPDAGEASRRGAKPTVPDFVPIPVPDDWRDRAACKGDTDPFFSNDPADSEHARWICRTLCPVRAECLTTAMDEEGGATYRHGIRGGHTGNERRSMYRRVLRRSEASERAAS